MVRLSLLLAGLVLIVSGPLLVTAASANSRCDCAYDKVVGECTAVIERRQNWVQISTPAVQQCSSVIWDINGYPQMSVVTDGTLTEPLIRVPADAKIAIRSCKVCRDANFPNSAIAPSAGDSATPTIIARPTASGTWYGYTTSIFGKQDATLTISVSDGRVSGTIQGPKESFQISGTQSGSTLNLTCNTHDGLQTITLHAEASTMQGSWRAGIFGGSMSLTRQ